MKLSIFILLIGLFAVQIVYAQATDLFISEYLEGSSNNKAIEIYNGTGNDVDLSNYMIKKATNGDGWTDSNYTFPENTVLQNFDVWVIANNAATEAILDVADEAIEGASYNNFLRFTGNDAVGLFKNGELIDIIGDPNDNPGTGWEVAGVADATSNHTLIRKSNITQGNTDWSLSAGTSIENSEWEVYDKDYMENLGFHIFDGAPDIVPPTLINARATSETTVDIIFSEEVTSETANNTDNYLIEGLTTLSAILQEDNKTVTITTSHQTDDTIYNITVSNINDLEGNTMADNNQIAFTSFVYGTPIRTIQENISDYQGHSVTIRGIITIGAGILRNDMLTAYIQDNSQRGIEIFALHVTSEYARDLVKGNELIITGTIDDYNGTTEIKDFTYQVISLNNAPNPLVIYKLKTIYDLGLSLEGTELQITGNVTYYSYAGGGTNITITDLIDLNYHMSIRIWDNTGINNLDYYGQDNFLLQVTGVATVYQEDLQIVPGYQEDLSEGTFNPYYYVSFNPSVPQTNQDITAIFNDTDREEPFEKVYIYWKTNNELSFHYDITTPSADSTIFTYTLPAQNAGTRIQFYYKAITDSSEILYPEKAPANLIPLDFPSPNLMAKLTVPAKPFDPSIGETFPIVFSANSGDKAILKIYNTEGKLKLTLYNGVISSYSGIMDIAWNGKDKNNNLLPIGLYICYLEVHDRYSGKTKTDKAPIMIGTQLK